MQIIKVLLSYSFRIFFLLGCLWAIAVMLLWTLALLKIGPIASIPNLVYWHAHEMLFGFVLAIIAGFILTAVAQWTGRDRVHGAALGWLATTWLAGRIAMMFTGEWPATVIAIADLCFPCLLTFLFGREVIAGGNPRNIPVVVIIGILAILNGLFHFGTGLDRASLLLTVYVVLALVTVISGRIIPAFTANWLRNHGHPEDAMPHIVPAIDVAVLILTTVTGVALTFLPTSPITGIAAFITACVHALRLSRWSGLHTFGEPLLFILHVAYAWIPIGYALAGIAVFGGYLPTVAMHALTIGGIGGMVLAMTTRVSLGHTGRPLHARRITVIAYCMLILTVATRLSGPLLGELYIQTVETAAIGWMLTFLLFFWVYWPVLTRKNPTTGQVQ